MHVFPLLGEMSISYLLSENIVFYCLVFAPCLLLAKKGVNEKYIDARAVDFLISIHEKGFKRSE